MMTMKVVRFVLTMTVLVVLINSARCFIIGPMALGRRSPNLQSKSFQVRFCSSKYVGNERLEASPPEYCPMIVNRGGGCFGISEKALQIYRERCAIDPGPELDDSFLERDDPVLVNIVKEMGSESFGRYANLLIEYYPSKYRGFAYAEGTPSVPGLETGLVDTQAYKLCKIDEIARSGEKDADHKVKDIVDILDDPCTGAMAYPANRLPKDSVIKWNTSTD